MITQEKALEIVKKAEEEYEMKGNQELTNKISRIVGEWSYYHCEDGDDDSPIWQKFNEGMGTAEGASSEFIANTLTTRINGVAELLSL